MGALLGSPTLDTFPTGVYRAAWIELTDETRRRDDTWEKLAKRKNKGSEEGPVGL